MGRWCAIVVVPALGGCWSALGLDDYQAETVTSTATTGGMGGTGAGQGNAGGMGGSGGIDTWSYADTVLDDQPVGYWRFGDSGGPALNQIDGAPGGQLLGNVTHGVAGALADSAFGFDGLAGTHVLVDTNRRYDFSGDSPFSLELWLRIAAYSNGGESDVLLSRCPHLTLGDGYALALSDSGQVRFSRNVAAGGSIEAEMSSSVTLGVYHHIVGVYDGESLVLYQDGVPLVTVGGADTLMPSISEPVTIGAGFSGGALYYQGDIDEVAIFPHDLSHEQVLNHYCEAAPAAPVCAR